MLELACKMLRWPNWLSLLRSPNWFLVEKGMMENGEEEGKARIQEGARVKCAA